VEHVTPRCSSVSTNPLGGEMSSDHLTKSIVNGELRFTWSGWSNYDDCHTSFQANWHANLEEGR
jgi:hypothetical protein